MLHPPDPPFGGMLCIGGIEGIGKQAKSGAKSSFEKSKRKKLIHPPNGGIVKRRGRITLLKFLQISYFGWAFLAL